MTSKPKILIVDDEERFRTTMAKLLTVNGLEVTAVGSGKDALEELKLKPYDVITLDIRMPGMSGLEALAEIKKVNPGVEVIILTGHASVDTAVEIMKLGGYEYLLKPTSTEELMNKIDAAYERKLTREQKTRKSNGSA
jgi:DNA-binding NtrC family response regulator